MTKVPYFLAKYFVNEVDVKRETYPHLRINYSHSDGVTRYIGIFNFLRLLKKKIDCLHYKYLFEKSANCSKYVNF